MLHGVYRFLDKFLAEILNYGRNNIFLEVYEHFSALTVAVTTSIHLIQTNEQRLGGAEMRICNVRCMSGVQLVHMVIKDGTDTHQHIASPEGGVRKILQLFETGGIMRNVMPLASALTASINEKPTDIFESDGFC
jgi:hypothetical protein